jgi:hypothetical protein
MCLLLLLMRPKICNKYKKETIKKQCEFTTIWADLADFESGAFIGKASTKL